MLAYCSFLCAIHRATPLLRTNSKHQLSPHAFQESIATFLPCYSEYKSQEVLVGHTMSHFQSQLRNALRDNTISLVDVQFVALEGAGKKIITPLVELWPLLDICVDSHTLHLQDTLLPNITGLQIAAQPNPNPNHEHEHATNLCSYDAHWRVGVDRSSTVLTLDLTINGDPDQWQGEITRLPELQILFPFFYQQVVMYTDYACGPSPPPTSRKQSETIQPTVSDLARIGVVSDSWQLAPTRPRETSSQVQHGLFYHTEQVTGLFYVVSNTFIAVKVQCLYPHRAYTPTRRQIPTIAHRTILKRIPCDSLHTTEKGWDWVVLPFESPPFLLGRWQEMEHWAIRFCLYIAS
jgi:hypothetical protein